MLALEDFHQARQNAILEQLTARLSGKPDRLLSYDEVRQKLKGIESNIRRLEDIPVDAIVGSVGRYNDFTRKFLPKEEVSGERWSRVLAKSETMEGLPPIEVYKIGEGYFVLDGNHRVSVARQIGMTHIQAYVTEIKTRVPFSPDDDPDKLILKAEYADFLERTRLDEIRPGANLQLTAPGKYGVLEEHIRVHQYFLGLERQQDIAFDEAVASFYENVYLPVVEIIRNSGLLREFPNRTEADLYLWLSEHRAAVQARLEMEVTPERAAKDLIEQKNTQSGGVVTRIGKALKKSLVPDELETGPPVGSWRRNILERGGEQRMVRDILIPISGEADGWTALDQGILIAYKENARLNGLHVIADEEDLAKDEVRALQYEFDSRCAQANVTGHLTIATGTVPEHITERTRWNDAVVINLKYPPSKEPLARLASGIRKILRRSFIPVLLTPRQTSRLNHALLAYDAGPASREALYLAAYLVHAWQMSLSVFTVAGTETETETILSDAREYLENADVQANYIHQHGDVAEGILTSAEENQCDWIMAGSYGLNPLLEVVWGSTLDTLLQNTPIPVLITR